MDKGEQPNVANCPHCTKIIFKDGVFNSEASFSTRCPHCNKSVKVIVKHKLEIILIAVHDEQKPKKTGPGTHLVVLLLVLYLPPILHRVMESMDNITDLLT